MRGRRFRELTGAGFVLSTLFVGARAAADPPQVNESNEDGSLDQTPDRSIDRARMITRLEAWPGVRSLWRELDLVEPGEQGYSFGAMDYETANLMMEKLGNLRYEMTVALEAESVSTLELDLIMNVTRMRMEMMSWGMPSMMTRMMPPPIEYDKGALLEDMERQIDHLLDLRDQGMLSVDQVRSATGSILDTFVAISIMNTITGTYGYSYMYDFGAGYLDPAAADTAVSAVQMADMAMAELERQFQSLTASDTDVPDYIDQDEVRQRYSAALEAVASVRSSTAGAGYLLGDLLLGAD